MMESSGFHRRNAAGPVAKLPVCGLVMLLAGWGFHAHAVERSFDCLIDPSDIVSVSSPVSGEIRKMAVGRGDIVEEGQLIVELDDRLAKANLDVDMERANMGKEIAALNTIVLHASTNTDRVEQLYSRKIFAPAQLTSHQAALEDSKLRLIRSESALRLAQLVVERSRVQLEMKSIYSPLSGIVQDKHLSRGELAREEVPILTLVQIDPLYVETYIPSRHYEDVNVGDRLVVRSSQIDNRELTARVIVKNRFLDPGSGTFGVRLELPNKEWQIQPGIRCSVILPVATPSAARETTDPVLINSDQFSAD